MTFSLQNRKPSLKVPPTTFETFSFCDREQCELWMTFIYTYDESVEVNRKQACQYVQVEVFSFESYCLNTHNRLTARTTEVVDKNKSMFNYLRTLTTWHCPHSPAAIAAIDRYLLPAGHMQHQTCSRGFAAVGPCWERQTYRETNRRTDYIPFHVPCSAYYAGSASNK